MARDIDRLIEHVLTVEYLPPTIKEVIIARLEPEPEQWELIQAHRARELRGEAAYRG